MLDDPIERLEAHAQEAEDAWRRGDFDAAFRIYAAAMAERLAGSGYGVEAGAKLEAADLFVLERLSDLALLLGRDEQADGLLDVAAGQVAEAGNLYWADLLNVKRADLAIGRGRPRAAQSLLNRMRPSIGDLSRIRFGGAGLEEWERRCHWPESDGRDRATIFALLYFVMGRLLAALGQYGEAEAALRRGLVHAEPGGEGGPWRPGAAGLAEQAVIPLRLALVGALIEKGELRDAAAHMARLKGQVDEQGRPGFFVQSLELEGKLSLLVGDLGAALKCLRGVLELCAGRGFVRAAVSATLNLAHAFILLNRTVEAENYLRRAREYALSAGDAATVARAEWLMLMAEARTQSLADGMPIAQTVVEQWEGEADGRAATRTEGSPADGEAPAGLPAAGFPGDVNPLLLPQAGSHLAFYEDRALGLHWLLSRRDFAACAAYLAQLKKIFDLTDSALIKLRLRVLSGLLAYYRNELEPAEKALTEALPELRRLRLLPELWQAQRFLGWCKSRLGRDQADRDELAAESARLLTDMAGTLGQEDRAFFLLNKWTAAEEELAAHINRLVRMKVEAHAAPWYRRPRARRRLTAQLEELLRVADGYRDITARRATDDPSAADEPAGGLGSRQTQPAPRPRGFWRRLWRGLSRRLGRDATISFLVLPDRVLIVRRSRASLDFGVSPATRLEVRELVRRWHALVARLTRQSARDLGQQPDEELEGEEGLAATALLADTARRVTEELGELLQLPAVLKDLPRLTRRLTLVPDDSLHGFPFAALTHRGHYLIERYSLTFDYRSEEREPVGAAGERRALLVGAGRGAGGWDELEFVPEELERVGGWARRRGLAVQRFDDSGPEYPAPDKQAVLAELSRAGFAHFACHGIFKSDRPAESGVVLRPARRPEVLSVRELSGLDLNNLRHVTLSACWSADHFILPGRWVISLPETFARAGASSVLGCLWVVDDRVGATFMEQFYRHLGRRTRAEALRRTQLACLRGELGLEDAPDTALPIFWAGYQLYGRGDALRL